MASDAPSVDDLLVSLDTASRDAEASVIAETIETLISSSSPENRSEAVATAVLIAFKRRNHNASQAQSTGAGEKKFLRSVLVEAAKHDFDCVLRVLPLVPIYGCWRDLLVLGEDMQSTITGGTGTDAIAATLVDAICKLFARQMAADLERLDRDEGAIPSSASKYAPHGARHGGASSARSFGRTTKGGKTKKRPRAEGVLLTASKSKKAAASDASNIAKVLASKTACFLGLPAQTRSAEYRKVRARLNRRLTEAGHLVEPILCGQRLEDLDFRKAPKQALIKYKKAIESDPSAARRWRVAMMSNLSAVPDLNDLGEAVNDYEAERDLPDDHKFFGRRIEKAVETFKAQKNEIVQKAVKLLAKLDKSSTLLEDPTLLPVVGAGGESSLPLRLLAAFVMARSQGLSAVAVHDKLVHVAPETSFDDFVATVKAAGLGAHTTAFCTSVKAGATALLEHYRQRQVAQTAAAAAAIEIDDGDATMSTTNAAVTVSESFDLGKASPDIMVLCSSFDAYANDAASLEDTMQELQGTEGCRSVLVHRLKSARVVAGADCTFQPRQLRALPPKDDVTVDVCFMMDLTGSMGSYMNQAKEHLSDIITNLHRDCEVADIRVSFVGYRDYRDNGRKVVKQFESVKNVARVVDTIRSQSPSGGGDEPEDVISGVEGVLSLDWQSDVRLCVFVADAAAHGYNPSKRCDDYPSGLCPDQKTKLPNLLQKLAHDQSYGVDMLFCQITPRTGEMEDMMQGVWAAGGQAGRGFGVLPMTAGASKFSESILGALSTSILDLVANDTVTSGLQTFDGQTLSALINTSNSSLRESVTAAAEEVRKAAEAKNEAAKTACLSLKGALGDALQHKSTEVDVEADKGRAHEETSELIHFTDVEIAADVAMPEVVGDVDVEETEMDAAGKPKRPPRTDAARLRDELMADWLHPVRLAVGLPVVEELAVEAAKSLISAGGNVRDLEKGNYPAPFIDAMRKAGCSLIEKC